MRPSSSIRQITKMVVQRMWFLTLGVLLISGGLGAQARAPGPQTSPMTAEQIANLPVTVTRAVEEPPVGSIQILTNGSFEEGWHPWLDCTGDPACWLTQLNPFDGEWHLRQGGNNGVYFSNTYQTVDLSVCDPDYPVWLYRAMAIDTPGPMDTMWTAHEGSIYRNDWLSIAYLWIHYENESTNGIYFDDMYQIEGLHEASAGLPVHLYMAVWTDLRVDVKYDLDAFSMWCPPKNVMLPRVWLPTVIRQED